ncbi:MAG: hypothetical protein HC783_02735 [Rhodobacteraceae bacterium]|nr:hypothetical protein [Paracoccaceae bacterium]
MNVLKRLIALTMGISWERTSARGPRETAIPVDDIVAASMVRVHQRAREVALDKHRRALERDFQANVLAGVSLPDLSLIAFYRIARDAMQGAGVDSITGLTGHEKALLSCMALAFDLTDEDYAALLPRINPEHREKTEEFRTKWREAHKREPRMAEIRADASRRMMEERKDGERAFEALHQEPDVATAYEDGRRQLQSGQPLCGAGETVYFLLPYGVQRARTLTAGTRPDWAAAPSFSALTRDEKAVVRHLHRLLAHASDSGVHMDLMTRRPQVETETCLFPTLAAALPGHPLPVAELPFGATPYPGHWPTDAALPTSWPSVFDTVLVFHTSWNGSNRDILPARAH